MSYVWHNPLRELTLPEDGGSGVSRSMLRRWKSALVMPTEVGQTVRFAFTDDVNVPDYLEDQLGVVLGVRDNGDALVHTDCRISRKVCSAKGWTGTVPLGQAVVIWHGGFEMSDCGHET